MSQKYTQDKASLEWESNITKEEINIVKRFIEMFVICDSTGRHVVDIEKCLKTLPLKFSINNAY